MLPGVSTAARVQGHFLLTILRICVEWQLLAKNVRGSLRIPFGQPRFTRAAQVKNSGMARVPDWLILPAGLRQ